MATLPFRFDFVDGHAVQQGTDWMRSFRVKTPAGPAVPFVASSVYALGEFVTKIADDGTRFLVVTAGTAAGTEPAWPTVIGGRVTSNTAVFMKVDTVRLLDPVVGETVEMDVRNEPDGDLILTLTSVNGRAAWGYDPPKWAVNTAYALTAMVVPTTPNGWIYRAVVAGTSHASTQPVWPTTAGTTITDGTVTWRNFSTDAVLTNLRVILASSATAALGDIGLCRYDLQLTDVFANQTALLFGNLVMEREIST